MYFRMYMHKESSAQQSSGSTTAIFTSYVTRSQQVREKTVAKLLKVHFRIQTRDVGLV